VAAFGWQLLLMLPSIVGDASVVTFAFAGVFGGGL
jgi:hypothetical protein